MISRLTVLAFVIFCSANLIQGQSGPTKRETTVNLRAVLYDPINAVEKLYLINEEEKLSELKFRKSKLSQPQKTKVYDGKLRLYDSKQLNPEDLDQNACTVLEMPPSYKDAILVVIPVRQGDRYVPRALVIDDADFAGGEGRIVNLMRYEMGVKAGEHLVGVSPGKVAKIPPVEERDVYNLAQTDFYSNASGNWCVFDERRVKYSERLRRIYLISLTPGQKHPSVQTIVDTSVTPSLVDSL